MKSLQKYSRSSGVLMPIPSLHGPFGIGVLGAEAREFIDFLSEAGFHAWQVLPVEHTGTCFSPYRCISTNAGEPMLIDPRMLLEMGLISSDELYDRAEGTNGSSVNYELVRYKQWELLRTAFSRLGSGTPYADFDPFWLEDYALYMAISQQHDFLPWFMWPEEPLRAREPDALKAAAERLREDVSFFKFVQWLFDKQWTILKNYAAKREITIIGDMPIYVSWDSVEVWARRDLFNMDSDGKFPAVGGVPPDYFNEDGQRWGDPIYNWKLMKEENFEWWTDRIRGAITRYDIVRIDHFRAFASYWRIPSKSPTAKAGRWVKGPGIALFDAMENALGSLPVIAEDLGVFGKDVEELLKHTGFRGMRVMQFGFSEGDDYHSPHSFTQYHVAYTGTHDNATMLEWLFEISPENREQALIYLGFEGDWTHGGPNSAISKAWMRSLLTSGASLTIVPIQDLLGYGADTRTNTPGTLGGSNWRFRIRGEALHELDVGYYRKLIKFTFRDNPLADKDDTAGAASDAAAAEAEEIVIYDEADMTPEWDEYEEEPDEEEGES